MVNNFYFFPAGGPLLPYVKLHIGREQLFFQFQFQAYREVGGTRPVRVDAETGLCLEVFVPPIKVESYADWRAFLRATPGVIKDGQGVTYSIEEFEARVAENAPTIKELRNPVKEAKTDPNRYGRGVARNFEWNDVEGFSFDLRSFG